MEKSLEELIREAIVEALYLEMGMEKYNETHVLDVAMRLSGAPFSFVKDVFFREKGL